MRKEYLVLLAAGCVAANAANVNYDLLGRKGSKMNSPMVYKNVDYSKMKKTEQSKTVSSLESASLAKTGMPDGTKAIEGFYDSRYGTTPYYFKKYTTSGTQYGQLYNFGNYLTKQNSSFITVNYLYSTNPNIPYNSVAPTYTYGNGSNVNTNQYTFNSNLAIQSQSPYPFYSIFDNIYVNWLGAGFVQDWDEWGASDVGVYMGADNLPIKKIANYNTEVKFVDYSNGNFTANPGHEMRESRSYSILRDASKHSVVYVGNGNLSSPASKSPQIYVGLRNNKAAASGESDYAQEAIDLDNFIYNNRTLEVVPAGNHGTGNHYLTSLGHAANAVTVGAVELKGPAENVKIYVVDSSSTENHYRGSHKPEVYNFSRFTRNDKAIRYTQRNNNKKYDFQPNYSGTEYAAAYTAAMVSDLLSLNPFYRWHPEVVKAMLLTSGGQPIYSGLPDIPPMTNVPSYQFMAFNNFNESSRQYTYHSRFWNGSIDKLRTYSTTYTGDKSEIWFIMPVNGLGDNNHDLKAAISWLSYGDDIAANNNKIPQDFDLYVYGTNDENMGVSQINNPGDLLGKSADAFNSYETVTFRHKNYQYLKFRIRLHSDDSAAIRKGEVVLGFNLAAVK